MKITDATISLTSFPYSYVLPHTILQAVKPNHLASHSTAAHPTNVYLISHALYVCVFLFSSLQFGSVRNPNHFKILSSSPSFYISGMVLNLYVLYTYVHVAYYGWFYTYIYLYTHPYIHTLRDRRSSSVDLFSCNTHIIYIFGHSVTSYLYIRIIFGVYLNLTINPNYITYIPLYSFIFICPVPKNPEK